MKIFIHNHDLIESQHKIKFEEPIIMVHPNGFISVRLDWVEQEESKVYHKNYDKFKYVSCNSMSFGGKVIGDLSSGKTGMWNLRTVTFEFEEVTVSLGSRDATIPATFDIVFATETEYEWRDSNGWQFIFHKNTGYGLVAWFAPRLWEDWGNAKPFEQ